MANLFERKFAIEIGQEQKDVALRLSDFRISFKVSKTVTPDTNKATIEIYNLNHSTRNSIEKTYIAMIKAGYAEAEGEQLLFVGDISLVNHTIQRPEVITTLECNDGERILKNTKLSLSYAEGFTISKILKDISSKLDIPNKVKIEIDARKDIEFTTGFSYVGQIRPLLDALCRSAGLEWSFQNEELKIQSEDTGDLTRAISISPDTGLINSPERLNDITTGRKKTEAIPGWKFVSLLQPKAEPGGIVVVNSRELPTNSAFKIYSVEHKGDNYGSDATTEIIAQDVGSIPSVVLNFAGINPGLA